MYRGDGTQGGFNIKYYWSGNHKETMHTSSSSQEWQIDIHVH